MANGKKNSIKITSIQCYGTSEAGNDEVYIYYQADAGLPVRYPTTSYQRMSTSADSSDDVVQTWNIDLVLDFDNEVLVTLWDQDLEGDNNVSEFLVNCDYTSSNPPASYNMKNHNGANYTLNAVSNA